MDNYGSLPRNNNTHAIRNIHMNAVEEQIEETLSATKIHVFKRNLNVLLSQLINNYYEQLFSFPQQWNLTSLSDVSSHEPW